MASITIAASLFGGVNVSKHATARRYSPIVAKASASSEGEVKLSTRKKNEECANVRRDVMFAAAAAAACSVAGIALAKEYPKRGTKEAKKVYAPVCVANPTASVCKN